MGKRILLINDLAGYGKVALSAMIPVLSHMKYEIYNLPTAIVSNTLDYGKFEIVSKEQTELITQFCKKKSDSGALIFTDPIMGDDGRLYNGIEEGTVTLMRELISAADYIVPNYTEAAYLAGAAYQEEGASEEELYAIVDVLRSFGAKSVVITSAKIRGSDSKSVVGYDHRKESCFRIDYNEIPVRFPGTGDIFSSVLIGKIMGGKDLHESTKQAMQTVSGMIGMNMDNVDKYKGIPIEACLEVIKE